VQSNPIPITLTAHLEGAFAGVAQAKTPGGHGHDRVSASPLQVTDRTMRAPVSHLRIPAEATPGLYNLTFRIARSGGSLSGEASFASPRADSAPGGRAARPSARTCRCPRGDLPMSGCVGVADLLSAA